MNNYWTALVYGLSFECYPQTQTDTILHKLLSLQSKPWLHQNCVLESIRSLQAQSSAYLH